MKPPNQYHPREREGGTHVCIKVKVLPSGKCWGKKRQAWVKPEARKSSSHWGELSAKSWLLLLVPPWLGREGAVESSQSTMSGSTRCAQIGQKMETSQGCPWNPVHQRELGSSLGRATCTSWASLELQCLGSRLTSLGKCFCQHNSKALQRGTSQNSPAKLSPRGIPG